ncbi:MAG: type IV pilin protein [Thiobacillaceae bacterium]|jgi:type IV pilus assembly protein PilE
MKGQNDVQAGFTLIELVIAVAIIGILATIAYASYTNYVKRGHRAEAKSALMQDATILERNFTEANRYDQTSAGNATGGLIMLQAPTNGNAAYNIAVAFANAGQNFTLTATRAGVMAGDSCGDFTLNNLGQQNLTNNTDSVADCWGK